MNDAEKLADLRHHWGSAYEIWTPSQSHNQRWYAKPREPRMLGRSLPAYLLSAPTAADLRLLIRADYDKRTVPTERLTGPASPHTSSPSPQ